MEMKKFDAFSDASWLSVNTEDDPELEEEDDDEPDEDEPDDDDPDELDPFEPIQ